MLKEVGDYLFVMRIVVVPFSETYLKNKMPDSAIYYAKLGYDSCKTVSEQLQVMRDNAEALANAYAYKKDFANAYTWHLLYDSHATTVY